MKTRSLPDGWARSTMRAPFFRTSSSSRVGMSRLIGVSFFRSITAGTMPLFLRRRATRVPRSVRFSAFRLTVSAMAVSLFEERTHGLGLMDPPDRFAEELGDREDLQVAGILPVHGDRVGDDGFADLGLADLLRRLPREDGVCGAQVDVGRAVGAHGARGLGDRRARRDHVVDED